jgi:signal peptidase II
MNSKKLTYIAILTIFLVLFIDQASKIWVKTHMQLNEEFLIFGIPWARIHFIENDGMAFGLSFGGDYGKLFLSIFRLLAVGFLFYLLKNIIQSKEKTGIIVAFSLILAGALGNIIDSIFYGVIFSKSPFHGGELATLFPAEGGYAPWLMGWVVDMFYFPMFQGHFPSWFPIWPGEEYEFFRPIFNVADSAIFTGICIFLIFYRSFFSAEKKQEEKAEALPD